MATAIGCVDPTGEVADFAVTAALPVAWLLTEDMVASRKTDGDDGRPSVRNSLQRDLAP